MIHRLVIKPRSAATACGLKVIAFYPQSHKAMIDGEDDLLDCVIDDRIDCPECLAKCR